MKTYFNDFRPKPKGVLVPCCECRNTILIKIIKRYPHSPDTVMYCPICGNKDLKEVK